LAQIRNTCIFCGGTGMSKEHVWPAWLSRFFPQTAKVHKHSVSRQRDGSEACNEIITFDEEKIKTGSVTSRRIRHVCEACNNGWMSDLQTEAKELLIPMLSGIWIDPTPAQQLVLARWATMFTMVYEYAHPPTVGISQDLRTQFMQTGRPPQAFRVWIGGYNGSRHGDVFHRGLGLYRAVDDQADRSICNAQSTVFAFGRIFFFVASSSTPLLDLAALDPNTRFPVIEIWPARTTVISRPWNGMSHEGFVDLAVWLSGEAARLYPPPPQAIK
jgi:hypothetical protein